MTDEVEQRRRRTRAQVRLRTLGADPATMSLEQLHQFYETQRAAYINVAAAGLHTTPIHGENDPLPGASADSRYGILVDALIDYYGAIPSGWSPARPDWPAPGEHPAPTVTAVHDAYLRAGVRTAAEARAEFGLQPLALESSQVAPSQIRVLETGSIATLPDASPTGEGADHDRPAPAARAAGPAVQGDLRRW